MKIYESEVTEPAKDLARKVQSILHFENYSKEMKVSDKEEMYTSVCLVLLMHFFTVHVIVACTRLPFGPLNDLTFTWLRRVRRTVYFLGQAYWVATKLVVIVSNWL